MLRVSSTYRLSALVLVALTATGLSPANSALRQDRAWKTYLNRTAGFCISYPARWAKSETYDGLGLAVTTGAKKHSPIPVGSMDVSALPGIDLHAVSLDLDNDFDLQMAGLKKFVRAEQVEILEKRAFTLGASPSLFMKVRYLDPRDRRIWVDEIIFSRRDRLSYRLELEARGDQLERFEANFTRFVNSFQMDCGSGTASATASNALAFHLTQDGPSR
jgi:hypothetical protein